MRGAVIRQEGTHMRLPFLSGENKVSGDSTRIAWIPHQSALYCRRNSGLGPRGTVDILPYLARWSLSLDELGRVVEDFSGKCI